MGDRYIVREPADGTQTGSTADPITTVKASDSIAVEDFDSCQVQISGITTGTVQVQSSLDGSAWIAEGSPLTADGIVAISSARKFVRANVTVATTVAVVVKAGGRQQGAYA